MSQRRDQIKFIEIIVLDAWVDTGVGLRPKEIAEALEVSVQKVTSLFDEARVVRATVGITHYPKDYPDVMFGRELDVIAYEPSDGLIRAVIRAHR